MNAEGTRFTEKKHEASVKFAQERGMPVLKHHLIPRTKGFTASLPFLKKKCPVILDIQLAFKKNDPVEPTIGNLLRGRAVTGYMHVRRIETKSLPDNEAEAAEWLHEFFRNKDRLQDSFHTYGDFFTGTGLKPLEPVRDSLEILLEPKFNDFSLFSQVIMEPRIATLANLVFWAIVTLTPILYYLVVLLFSGKLLYTLIAVGIISVCKYFKTPALVD